MHWAEVFVLTPIGAAGYPRAKREATNAAISARLQELLAANGLQPEKDIPSRIHSGLVAQGYKLSTVPPDMMGPPKDPLDLKLNEVKNIADAVLTIRLVDNYLHGFRVANGHSPQFNISVELVDPRDGKSLFERTYYYGVDAEKNRPGHFPARADCIFGNLTLNDAFGTALSDCLREGSELMLNAAMSDLLASMR